MEPRDQLTREARVVLRRLQNKRAHEVFPGDEAALRRVDKSIAMAVSKLPCAHPNTVTQTVSVMRNGMQLVVTRCSDCKLTTKLRKAS